MYQILPNLTKDFILSKVSQEAIFEKYLGINVQTESLFLSPLRKDKNPTCGFAYNVHGKLRLKDFSGDFWGDCFDVVGRKLGIDSNTKQGFNIVLDNIAQAFNLHKYSDGTNIHLISNQPKIEYIPKIKNKSLIEIKIRNWNKLDEKYWNEYGISIKLLNHFNVFPCEIIWLNKEISYTYNINDPSYAYHFGNGEFKIYYPFRKHLRFLSNTSTLQGINKLTCGKFCVITKSYKDSIALKGFGIDSVAPSSETHLISKEDYSFIKLRYDFIFSLMDYDNTGIKMSKKLKEVYNVEPIYFTDKLWNRKKGIKGAKDLTDYIKKFGQIKTLELIQKIYEKYEPIFEENTNWFNEKLSWI